MAFYSPMLSNAIRIEGNRLLDYTAGNSVAGIPGQAAKMLCRRHADHSLHQGCRSRTFFAFPGPLRKDQGHHVSGFAEQSRFTVDPKTSLPLRTTGPWFNPHLVKGIRFSARQAGKRRESA